MIHLVALLPLLFAQRDAVLDDLENRARAALAAIPHATNKAEADRVRRTIRPKLSESLGFARLPPSPREVQTLRTGIITRDGYRIEQLIIPTLPGVFAPAHFYLPEHTDKPVPTILFYNGHWWPDSKARPDFQAFCINMARWGIAVLSFDPFGQGERGVSSRDHRRTELLLGGVSQQGLAEYETRLMLDYLLGRPEVDRTRIGMTGASGGGFNTWITAALDDRIKVAVPVVGTSEFFEQIHVTRPLDWYKAAEHCHFVPGLITYANNHELLAAVYPRPLMIISARVDQSFPVEGVRAIHEYGRKLYQSSGDGPRIGYFEDAVEGHGYQKAKREAAYGWFLKWLLNKGDGSAVLEPPTQIETFKPGEKFPAGPGIVEAAKRITASGPPAKLPKNWQQNLGKPLEPAFQIPSIVTRPDGTPAGVLVAVDDRGKEALATDPVVTDSLRRNSIVWAIDPRGIGELSVERGWVFAVSLLLGENFVFRQGSDILRMAQLAGKQTSLPVTIYARGHNATLAATYAAAMSDWRPFSLILRNGFDSFRQFSTRPVEIRKSFRLVDDDIREQRKTAFDVEIPSEYVPFGALLRFDLASLRALTNTKMIEPIDGDWQVTAESNRRPPPSPGR